jgi:hypothetical protein
MTRSLAVVLAVLVMSHPARAQDTVRADGWVVLPIDEYRALRARAYPTTPDPAPPPVDAALTRIDYDLRVAAGGETATGQARLVIDVLKQGWVSVQVPPGLLVRDAKIDGRSTSLVEGSPARVLLSRPGRATLVLDVVVPLASQGGAESMSLPASGSALAAVTLAVPRTGVDLAVTGGFIAEHSEADAESRWVVYGSAGRPLSFAWKRKADDRRGALPLRTRARVTELVSLGEDVTHVTSSILLEVTQGLARDAVIAIPPGLIVNQVAGAAVADWNVDRGMLTVSFLEPVTSQTSVVVTGEVRGSRDGAMTIPLLRVGSAERETGGVAVDVAGAGEIGARQPRGLEPADPSDLGDIVAGRESPSMVAFRFTPMAGAAPRALSLHLTRYTDKAVLVANVEEARYDALLTEDGKHLVRARYAVRNNQRSFLAVTLPPGATLWSASLAGRPVRPGLSPGGGLLLPLRKGRPSEEAAAFVVELLYLERGVAWPRDGDARIVLPAVDLPVSRTGLTIHHSPRFGVEAKAGAFRVETDPGPWSAALRSPHSYAAPPPPPPAPRAATAPSENEKEFRAALDQLKQEAGRVRQGVVPVAISFPAFGPSLFLAAELTPESQAPALDIQVRSIGGHR